MRYLSLCSGIEAATVAWSPLGWEPAGLAEIEPFCCAVLETRWPGVRNLGDLTTITDEHVAALGPVDVVIGGTPCQDLSVAGKRAGIEGTRSSLFFDFVRIFDAARRLCGARWCVWENVPGAFSTHNGRDFAVVVSTLAGCRFDPPADGWRSSGAALGPRGLVEWRVLDAQFFGLAQRRKRVFAIVDSGDWQGRAPVLLEPEGVRGDSPPRREAGARTAGTLTASALDGSSACAGDGRDGLMVAGPLLSTSHHAGWRSGAEEAAMGHLVPEVGRNNFRLHNVVLDTAAPLTHGEHPGSNVPGRRKEDDVNLVACFDTTQVTHPENRSTASPDTAALAALAASAHPPAVAFAASAVRRLTPTECERLQGFPDGYTLIVYRRKPAKDGPRYAALGNSMAVYVIRWLGLRLAAAHKPNEAAA